MNLNASRCALRAARLAPRRGQSLVEAMVAAGILAMGLMGIMSLLAQSFGLNRVVTDNYTATYLSAEGIEVVKNIMDTNRVAGRSWDSGLGAGIYEVEYDSRSLLPNQNRNLGFDPSSKLYSYGGTQETPFRRTVTLTRVSADELKIVAAVTWASRGGSYATNLEDHFYNWRP